MRNSFEDNVRQYNALAKNELELGEGKKPSGDQPENKELAELKTVVDWETKKNAGGRETSQAAQLEIYSLQRTKQNIFQKLERDLAMLDNPKESIRWEKGSKKVLAGGDKYFAVAADGQKMPVTLGEIFSDGDWGIKYAPDDGIPRPIRKKYLIEAAKRKIRARLNRQIYIDEIASRKTGEGAKGAYTRKFEEEELAGELPPGILAEKMVDGLLKKMSYVAGSTFELIESDVHLDVIKKIDFIVRRKSHYRGVGVEAEDRQDVGIQFTTSTNNERLTEKRSQLKRANTLLRPEDQLEEIILVSVPLKNLTHLYEQWKAAPTPGGPEKLWDKRIKREVFEKVLSGMLSKDELEEQWKVLESAI